MRHLRYEYDLISGNVKMVRYQNGDDGMRHRYTYDADNRLTEVKTSADGQVWYTDAEYFYYPHGPLRRVELGQPKVQGMDYAYTLQGWLKGINSDLLEPKNDMGQDGVAGTANASVGRDAFGMSIGYYGDDDYSAIDDARWDNQYGTKPFAAVGGAGTLAAAHNPLYNGNIAHTVNSLQPWGGWTAPSQPAQVLAQVYRYDQLNRLKQAQGVEGLTVATNSWEGVTDAVADRYKSAYTYDANGNILTAERHDETGQQYDDFAYQYHDPGGLLAQNRLYDLYDAATHTTGADIVAPAGTFDNSTTGVNQNNNYKYDELGNLIADTREEIHSIDWTVAGKVKRIARTPGSTKPELVFAYGADGQRISKQVGEPTSGGHKEYYIRDASGNIMATYRYLLNPVPNTNPPEYESSLKLTERPIYGSSRIGSHTRQMEMVGSTPPQYYPYIQPMHAPLKRYELTDHLGNVATVVTGKLLPGNGAGSAYQADVVSAQGYEAFGALLPGRNYSSGSYRYLFQGQEHDDEINGGVGTSYSWEYRVHDPRIGRFLSIDPLVHKYPWWSPYSFAGNMVIQYRELEGLEPAVGHPFKVVDGKQVLKPATEYSIADEVQSVYTGYMNSHLVIHGQNAGELQGWLYYKAATEAVAKEYGADKVIDFIDKAETLSGVGAIVRSLLKQGVKLAVKHGVREGAEEVVEKGTRVVAERGFKSTAELGLKDGMRTTTKDALTKAEDFLGAGYTELGKKGSGRYVSADGLRQVRMGAGDLAGKGTDGVPHLNFETLVPNPAKPGKNMVTENLHILLDDAK